ncbi:hypothetical protein GOP47_0004101 [Adiantum capillus-veneris]|uniref:Desiccation-related protein PCC13-62 n=1 Tax=Adiantum capillus-veneris TaxID=13818 RepID=A0A9D4ZMA0_ADICA|nr:hypothetical protein GOP47_0004101 [Adiantum capillus-veneris]
MHSRSPQFAPLFLLLLICAVGASWSPPLCKANEYDEAMAPQQGDVCQEPPSNGSYIPAPGVTDSDADNILVALNLEYLESEFFLFGATGAGLDRFAPELAAGGPAPIGAQKANLDNLTRDIIEQFGYQEVGHLRAIKETIPEAFPRVQLDLRKEVFAATMEAALGKLPEPFDAYANSQNYLLASYLIPYVGLTGYVGANPQLQSERAKRLVAGLLAVESGQDAVIRTLLYEQRNEQVVQGMTVADVTEKISQLRNKLGKTGIVDEGLVVPQCLGAEGRTSGNSLAGDANSVGYARTPAQIFRIVYGTGNESMPGGFYPEGGRGRVAESFL